MNVNLAHFAKYVQLDAESVVRRPWRSMAVAVAAGAVMALLPNRIVRAAIKSTVLGLGRDAVEQMMSGGSFSATTSDNSVFSGVVDAWLHS